MIEQEFTTEELNSEEWREIDGYAGVYSVSSLGRVRRNKAVRSIPAGYIVKTRFDKDGYLQLNLRIAPGLQKTHPVHKLVAAAFLGECPLGQEVNHIKSPKTNNRVSNLEYLTHAKNVEHAIANGLINNSTLRETGQITRGEKVWTAKLTENKVREIMALIEEKVPYIPISLMYGISVNTVQRIKLKKTWKHVICQPPYL